MARRDGARCKQLNGDTLVLCEELTPWDNTASEKKAGCVKQNTKDGSKYKRKWSVGGKFDESVVTVVLPHANAEWTSFHPKEARNVKFQPSAMNTPIGNTADMSNKSLLQVVRWQKSINIS